MRSDYLDYASKLIRRKARTLAKKVEFADVNCADIEHDLLLELIKSWPSFDPARAKAATFISRIVENGTASMFRRKRAAKRDIRKTVGLPDGGDVPAGDVEESEARRRRGLEARDPLEVLGMRLDVAAAISDLPSELQCLCGLLKQHSLSDVSRLLSRPRTSLYDDLRLIRRHFEDIGLREYI